MQAVNHLAFRKSFDTRQWNANPSAKWIPTCHSYDTQDKIRAMNVWLKYGQVLNDPVRNLNIRLAFQSSNVTDAQLARGNFTAFDVWINTWASSRLISTDWVAVRTGRIRWRALRDRWPSSMTLIWSTIRVRYQKPEWIHPRNCNTSDSTRHRWPTTCPVCRKTSSSPSPALDAQSSRLYPSSHSRLLPFLSFTFPPPFLPSFSSCLQFWLSYLCNIYNEAPDSIQTSISNSNYPMIGLWIAEMPRGCQVWVWAVIEYNTEQWREKQVKARKLATKGAAAAAAKHQLIIQIIKNIL